MSIKAMKQALAALETCRIRSVSEWSVEDITPKNVTAAIAALRTAIQQAEAKTDEKVRVCVKVQGGEAHCTTGQWMSDEVGYLVVVPKEWQPAHPAPGVPDDVVRDAERYRWLRSEHERNDPICHLTWKRNMDRSEWRWVNTAVIDSSIDAAMTAAQAQKGQP